MAGKDLHTRRLAIGIFSNVYRNKTVLEEEFSRQIDDASKKMTFEPRDRTFIRLLVSVMLRHLGQIDHILAQFVTKPLPERAEYIKDVLRISTAQLIFLDTPPHAAVSTGVSLAKTWGVGGFSNLVNAVLRQVSLKGKEILATQNPIHMNVPSWLYNSWVSTYGKENARKIAVASLSEPSLDFTVKNDSKGWAEKLEGMVMPFGGTVRRQKSTLVQTLDGFDEGHWWVQDFSASLPVKLFQDLSNKTAIDLCAAPGGKTAQLVLAGAKVTALDVSENRLKRLDENMKRLGFEVETIVGDAKEWWEEEGKDSGPFDAVLLDAPCSATGTLRRHPDILWHRTPENIDRLSKIQIELLRTALDMLEDDGELVYSVCSLLSQEGVDVVDQIIEEDLAVRVPLTKDVVPEFMISEKGDLLVFPYFYEEIGGCDGFYAARLRRKGARE